MKKVAALLFFIAQYLLVIAGNVEFTASVNQNQLAAGERFQIEFSLNGSGSNFIPPNFPSAFRVLSGPNQSSSMQWVNGQMSSSISYSFVLQAMQEGEFTIPSANITAGKDILKTNPITITVRQGNAPPPTQQQQSQPPQASSAQDASEDVFIKVYADKTKVYQGEQIIATYKLYTKAQLVDNAVTKLPDLTGFWSQDVEIKSQLRPEVLNGVRYDAAILKQSVLFPQRTGTLELDPMGFDCIIRVRSNQRPRSVFDQFFGSFQDVKLSVKNKPLKIEVLPLPQAGKPGDFSGAVGKITLETKLNKNQVKANDAVNLTVKIAGSGNLKLIEAPKFNFPPDFEVYDPKINDQISVTASGVSGKREFEYLVIPRHAGVFTLPPVMLSYFDIAKKQYVTLTSDTFRIVAEKGEESTVTTFSSGSKEDIKYIGKDIRYIKTHPIELKEKGKYFFASALFDLMLGLPILLFFFLLFFRKQYVKQQDDVVKLKSRKATKMARKRLAVAKKHLQSKNQVAFYDEVFKALYGFLSDRLSIPVSDLSKETIAIKLSERKIEKEIIDKLFASLDLCEMARFAPVNNISGQQVYNEAVSIISHIY